MNVFAAACMLSRISLEGLLDMTDEERNDMFGDDVGLDRLVSSFVGHCISSLTLRSSS